MMTDTYRQKNSPVVRQIFFAMLAPTILMNLTTALASFADTVIIGYFLDDLSLSVVTYATPIYMIINTFAALFAVGGSIAIGVDAGKGDKAGANRAFSLSVELLAAIGLLLTIGGFVFTNQIPGWLGVETAVSGEAVFTMVRSYATIITVSAPIFMLNVGLAFFVRNDGRPTLSMVGMMLSIGINILFDTLFIGVFGWGVAGAAYATVFGQLFSMLVIATHFLSKKNTMKFRFVFGKEMVRIVKNGGSTALHFVYQFLTILIINHLITKLAGTNGVVVYTIVFNLYTVSLALFEGISQTIQPMISLFYGEQNILKMKQTLKLAFLTVVVICGSVTLVLEIFPQAVPILFGVDDAALVASCATAVRIFSASMLIMTVNVVIGYYLQSTEQSFMAAVLVSLRCFVLFLLGVFLLGYAFGMNGIWAAYTVAEVCSFVVYLIMNSVQRKRLSKKECDEKNFLLLSKAVEDSIVTELLEYESENAESFIQRIRERLEDSRSLEEQLKQNTVSYLQELLASKQEKKKRYVEVDVIEKEEKIIIRDNLEHSSLAGMAEKYLLGEESDASPSLGFYRVCLKR